MITARGRIQIVEDEFIIAEDLKGALEHLGHTVVGMAETYKQAKEQIAAYSPELVLLDINLGGNQDGIKLGKMLAGMGTPFIYISAYIDAETREKAQATGPKAFLTKPFDNGELEVNIKFALGISSSFINKKRRGGV